MELWCPFAVRKPLGPQTESRIGTPRVFLIHTMVGYLRGTDSMFRQGGYSGTESTFGIGGSWDPDPLDGAIWQWQDLSHSADAQYAGNAYATSVETSDGGKPSRRWSDKQAEAIIKLGVWWCRTTGNPARLVTSTSGRGFGWHAQFRAWNESSHNCPGDVRLEQYKKEIIPEIARRLAGEAPSTPSTPSAPSKPSTDWTTEAIMSLPTIKRGSTGLPVRRLQGLLVANGSKVAVDGIFGPDTEAAVRHEQTQGHIGVDGIVGKQTWTELLGA